MARASMKLYTGFHPVGRPQATMRQDTGNRLPNGFLHGIGFHVQYTGFHKISTKNIGYRFP